jgi:pimeloyl-ACP methyl ester carboxylesterase
VAHVKAPRDEIVHANGVNLCVDSIGDPSDPPILLIMGSGASMDWWEDEFCERLAAGGRFVVRYDHRDTGRSVSYEPGAPGYTGDDLIDDVVGLLDALDIPRAHLVGMSMGGAIAQVVALDHPERVASLTLISTSPAGPDDDLPGMSPETVAAFKVDTPDWSDREAVIDYMVHLERVCASRSQPFDEPSFREICARAFDRTVNIESMTTNHNLLEGGARWRERLPELDLPTLVIHGTDDPVLPYPHGEALANEIPGAGLLTLEATGHELPRRTWDVAAPAILEVSSG